MSQSPPRPRRSRKRDAILAAAQDMFMLQGFAGTAMDDVADRAGVSKQTIYAHFPGKEALFLTMADAMIAGALAAQDRLAPLDAPGGDPGDVLLGHALQQLETARSPRLMQLRRLAIAEQDRFPEFGARVFHAGPGGSIARLERAFAAWHAAGRLHAPDARRAAETFNWLIMGGPTSEAMLLGAPRVADDGERDAHAREAVRVILAGCTTSSG